MKNLVCIDKDAIRTKAKTFSEQGNFNHALIHLAQIHEKDRDDRVHQLEKHCRRMLLRKYWKQGRADDFAKIMSGLQCGSSLSLVHARLKGMEQLNRFANEVEEGPIKALALSAVAGDLRRALLTLHRQPVWSFLAEGWMALLKRDFQNAEALFAKASANATRQAEAGQELTALIKDGVTAIGPLLSSLKTYASRFPQLAKTMGWSGSVSQMYKIETILYQMPLDSLQTLAKSKLPRTLLGWIELRIGDSLAPNSIELAIRSWDKALKLHSGLKIDVLKRRFLSVFSKESPHEPKATFFALYQALKKASPEQARSFIEHLIFTSRHRIENWLDHHDLRSPRSNEWTVEPTQEVKLLWLSLTYSQSLIRFNRVLGLSPADIGSPCGCGREDWQALLMSLDTAYLHQEKYLKIKQAAALLLGDRSMLVDTTMALLLQNPQLKDEILPYFIKHATQEDANKVVALRRLFPRDPDLIRLDILYTQPKELWLDRADDQATLLSAPLLATLKAQLAFDQQRKSNEVRQFFPEPALLGCDREADCRFMALICHKNLAIPAKQLNSLIQQIAPDSKTKHAFFLYMARYGYGFPKESVLHKWCKNSPNDWQPYFHRASYLIETDEFFEALDDLDQARVYISHYEPEISVIEDTLTFYEAQLPEIEELGALQHLLLRNENATV